MSSLTDLRFAEPPPGGLSRTTVPGFPTLSDSYTIYTGFDHSWCNSEAKTTGLWAVRAGVDQRRQPDADPLLLEHGHRRITVVQLQAWRYVWHRLVTMSVQSNEFGPLPQALFGPATATVSRRTTNSKSRRCSTSHPTCNTSPGKPARSPTDAFVYGVRMNIKL